MKKLNNKGFSLVELIIVIAIMAILVGVVGTQVIPYLENSRKAKDQQVLSAWNTAAVSAYSTEAGNLDALHTYVIEITDGNLKVDTTAYASLTGDKKALCDCFMALTTLTASGYDFDTVMASKAGKNITSVTITIDGGNGTVETATACNTGYSFDKIENK